MNKPVFSYTANDEDPYLTWFKSDFSSVFVATNPFLKVPQFPSRPQGESIPEETFDAAKRLGADASISWHEIAELCGFPSIAYVNRALRLAGSKRIIDELAYPADTATMLKLCREQNILTPEEGELSPFSELSVGRFLTELGHGEVFGAGHFGVGPEPMKSESFLLPEGNTPPEIHTRDNSVYISIYTDYHYFLICQTDDSRSKANPADYFEGFFADENTNDLWGVGDLR